MIRRTSVLPGKALYSFDLFDTLVTRPLKRPGMVFYLLGRLGVDYRLPLLGLLGFRFWRVMAERVARRLSRDEDINLFDIYRVLAFVIRSPAVQLKRELAVELALLQPIVPNVEVVTELLAEGKQCCIVSDMYLPSATIGRIIRKHVGKVDFFVSSREGLTKRSGKLFRHMLECYRLAPAEVQHFGDNPVADDDVPRRLGIDTVLLPGLNRRGRPLSVYDVFYPRAINVAAAGTVVPASTIPREAAESTFNQSALNQGGRSAREESFFRAGYDLVGPCSIALARFIAADARRQGLSRVIFAARDGYLLKEAFDTLGTGIDSRYVRLSRRALYLAAFALSGDYERFFEGRVSAADFFSRLGFDCPAALLALDPARHRQSFINALKQLGFEAVAHEEALVMRDYLYAQGFAGKVGFVDLGWRGSLQAAVQELCGEACRIHGYYFGSIADAVEHRAFYFEHGRPLVRCATVFQALPVFEFLFTEPVHTLRRVRRGRQSASFEYEFVADEPERQFGLRHRVADGARRFFADIGGLLPMLEKSDCGGTADLDSILQAHLKHPSADFICAFTGVGHAEGFGGSKYDNLLPAEGKSLAGYRNAYWRSAYVSGSAGLGLLHRLLYSRLGMFLILRRARIVRRLQKHFSP